MHIDTIFCLQVSIGDNHHLLVKMDGDLEIKITTMDHLRNLNGDLEAEKAQLHKELYGDIKI